eukprot:Gb_17292 [translate_table: standard]
MSRPQRYAMRSVDSWRHDLPQFWEIAKRSPRNMMGKRLKIRGIKITRNSCEDFARHSYDFIDGNWEALTSRKMYDPHQFLKTFYQALGWTHLYNPCHLEEGEEAFVPWPQTREGCSMISQGLPNTVYADEDLQSPSKFEELHTTDNEFVSQQRTPNLVPLKAASPCKCNRSGKTSGKPLLEKPKESKKRRVADIASSLSKRRKENEPLLEGLETQDLHMDIADSMLQGIKNKKTNITQVVNQQLDDYKVQTQELKQALDKYHRLILRTSSEQAEQAARGFQGKYQLQRKDVILIPDKDPQQNLPAQKEKALP